MDKQYDKRIRRARRRPVSGNTHRFTQNDTKKNYQTRKRQVMMEYMISGSRNSIHDRLTLEMNRCLQGANVPEWMTKEKASLIQKDPSKETASNNITRLPMLWKILTAQIREEIYYSLTRSGLFPEEQKGCCIGSRGRAELLNIDQHILNESKTRRKNLAMAWIDYKKVYDMVPHSLIINCLKMYKISHEVINFIEETMDY